MWIVSIWLTILASVRTSKSPAKPGSTPPAWNEVPPSRHAAWILSISAWLCSVRYHQAPPDATTFLPRTQQTADLVGVRPQRRIEDAVGVQCFDSFLVVSGEHSGRRLAAEFAGIFADLLQDGSSLGVHGGRIFKLELACADALSKAMTLARERHGIFVFTGNTRHRVEVSCLKDFQDPRFVPPGRLGLAPGGYTRLGAPLRHLTSRLLSQPSERRLLIVIGDGLISDEGYEGHYAWADVAHAVEEANDAGVSIYYVGVGPTRVDPLPAVFGPRRSQRIRRVEELPRALAHVHRELVTA